MARLDREPTSRVGSEFSVKIVFSEWRLLPVCFVRALERRVPVSDY